MQTEILASSRELINREEFRAIASRREKPQARHRTSPRERGEVAAGDPPIPIFRRYSKYSWRKA